VFLTDVGDRFADAYLVVFSLVHYYMALKPKRVTKNEGSQSTAVVPPSWNEVSSAGC